MNIYSVADAKGARGLPVTNIGTAIMLEIKLQTSTTDKKIKTLKYKNQ